MGFESDALSTPRGAWALNCLLPGLLKSLDMGRLRDLVYAKL